MRWAAAGLVVAASLWHARFSRAGKPLVTLRLLAAAAVILALLNPAVQTRRGVARKPGLLIIIDSGRSMAADNGAGSRLKRAVSWLQKNRPDIEAAAQVRLAAVSDDAQDIGWDDLDSLAPSQATFNPSSSLPQAQADVQAGLPKRIWLISDGVSDATPPEDILASLGAPIDVLGVGREPQGREVSFADARPPDFAFLHHKFSIPFSLKVWGTKSQSVGVKLFRESQSGAPESLQSQVELAAPAGFSVLTASLPAVAQNLGSESLRLEASLPGGASAFGPEAKKRMTIQVIRQKYRIMLLAGRPSPEYIFLRQFLKSDPNRELVSFVILRNPENMIPIPDNELSLIPFPEQEIFMQDVSQFDLFILENFSPARFYLPDAYLRSLRNYVAKGGALLIIGGENAFNVGGYRGTALEDLLPAKLSEDEPDFMPGLYHAAPLDYTHPLVNLYDSPDESRKAWAALPDLDGYARLDSVDPQAAVVAVNPEEKTQNGEPLPVIAVRPYGRGKVMMITTDSTWHWRLAGSRVPAAADFYQRFWSRAVEYLSGSLDLSKVEFVPLPEPLPGQEPLDVSLRVFDAQFRPAPQKDTAVSVSWAKPSGLREILRPQNSGPGLYRISLTGIPLGAQRLDASVFFRGKPWGKNTLNFSWNPEAQTQPMDRRWLEEAAQDGGGNYANLERTGASGLLARLPKPEITLETTRDRHPFGAPWFVALACALFVLEIFLRRLKGHA